MSFPGPVGNLGRIGPCVNAQLGGAKVVSLVGIAVMEAGRGPGAVGEKVGAALGDVSELGDGGVVLGLGEAGVAGVATGGSLDAGDDDVVCGTDGCHEIIVECVFE
jgi:hypothetical protein